ncbi:MAG: hypothetical protein LBR54_04285, partial [Oscillospiraceae bacterium]|nr:hypothetical protein [Oscillospiraceae bacterium]
MSQINFILGSFGSGKSALLMDRINEAACTVKENIGNDNANSGWDAVYFLVPEQFSFEANKRLYRTLGVRQFNKIQCVTYSTLCDRIFSRCGKHCRKNASDMIKSAVMYAAVKNALPVLKYYRKQAKTVPFIEKAAFTVEELRKGGISPDILFDADIQDNDKFRDIALIQTHYTALLEEKGLQDNTTAILEAAALARANGYFKNSCVFIDGFDSFSADEYELIDVMLSGGQVHITLCTADVAAAPLSLFENVNKTYAKLVYIAKKHSAVIKRAVLKEQYRLFTLKNERLTADRNAMEIIEAKNIYSESEYVCAEIRRLTVHEGYRYRDITVAGRYIDTYANVLESMFKTYDIPYFISVKRNVTHTALMVYVTSVLELLCAQKFKTSAVLRLIKTQLSGISYTDAAMLENYCFKWRIDGDAWLEPFVMAEDNKDHKESGNEKIEAMRKHITEPLTELKIACNQTTGLEICKQLYLFLEKNMTADGGGTADRAEYEILTDMLDALAEVLSVPVTLREFKDIFTALLKLQSYSIPPPTLDSVTVAQSDNARYNEPKAIFIMGANDGMFPAATKAGGLFTEDEKEMLAGNDIVFSRTAAEIHTDELFCVYKALSAATDKVFVSYALSDLTGKPLYPSRLLDRLTADGSGTVQKKPVIAENAGILHYASTMKAAYNTYVRGFSYKDANYAALKQILCTDDFYRSRVEHLDLMSNKEVFRLENKDAAKELFGKKLTVSASRFENYNTCPFMFFCSDGLKLKPRIQKDFNAL